MDLKSIFKRRKRQNFRDMPSSWLILFGLPSFLVTAFFGYLVNGAATRMIPLWNEHMFTLEVFVLSLVIGFLAIVLWVFGCVTARCHLELFDRWFK